MRLVINPIYHKLLIENNFETFEQFMGVDIGEIVDKNRKRCVYKIKLYDKSCKKDRIFYIKLFHTPSLKNSINSIFSYGRPQTEAKIEWDNAKKLFDAGFHTVPLVAYGQKIFFGVEVSSFFMTEEIADSISLDQWFQKKTSEKKKELILESVGDLVKKLHKHMFSYPDLYLKHIFLDEKYLSKNIVRFSLLDLHRLRKRFKLSTRSKAKDLAALKFSCQKMMSEEEIKVWLNRYLIDSKEKIKLENAVAKRLKKISSRRSHASSLYVREIEGKKDHLYINEEFYPVLSQFNLDSFSALYNHKTDENKLTDNPGRLVDTFSLKKDNREYRFYIKKHYKRGAKLKWGESKKIIDAARVEWKSHLLCEKIGIFVPRVVAWGFSLKDHCSLMITLEVEGNTSLENILRNDEFPVGFDSKKYFIKQVAGIAKKLHGNNYCHKDFYTGHILVSKKDDENHRLKFYLIDLQRIIKMNYLRTRWIIKDLAQLNFSSQYPNISLKDRIRFLHCFLGVNKLSIQDRRLAVGIISKTEKINRHVPKVVRRKKRKSGNKKSLKIAFNIDHFIASKGGAERYLVNLSKFLLDRGHIVHVYSMDGHDTIIDRNFRFYKIPVIGCFRWLKSLSFIIRSSIRIKKQHYDIVQVLGKNLTMNVFQPHGGSHRASFRQNIMAVSENKITRLFYLFFRLFDIKQWLFFLVEWLQFNKKPRPRLFGISKMVISDLKRYYNLKEEDTQLIYNGVNIDRFSIETRKRYRDVVRKELGIEDGCGVILYVGHNFKLKGLKYFLLSLHKALGEKECVRALIVGKGKKKNFIPLIKRLGMAGKCVFIDSTTDIEKYYSASDVLLQPTFYDPCSLSTIESLACGLPVITTKCNGAGELIIEGETGFVVENPYCVDKISEKILFFLNQPEAFANSSSDSVQQYSNENVYLKILDEYNRIANN